MENKFLFCFDLICLFVFQTLSQEVFPNDDSNKIQTETRSLGKETFKYTVHKNIPQDNSIFRSVFNRIFSIILQVMCIKYYFQQKEEKKGGKKKKKRGRGREWEEEKERGKGRGGGGGEWLTTNSNMLITFPLQSLQSVKTHKSSLISICFRLGGKRNLLPVTGAFVR